MAVFGFGDAHVVTDGTGDGFSFNGYEGAFYTGCGRHPGRGRDLENMHRIQILSQSEDVIGHPMGLWDGPCFAHLKLYFIFGYLDSCIQILCGALDIACVRYSYIVAAVEGPTRRASIIAVEPDPNGASLSNVRRGNATLKCDRRPLLFGIALGCIRVLIFTIVSP